VAIPAQGLRLNLGCGKKTLPGYFNVDAEVHPDSRKRPDLLCDIRKLPLPDECAVEVMALHVFEHFYRWDCDDVIKEWRRLLRKDGLLVMEMPDLFKFCLNILEGKKGRKHEDQLGLWGLFGDPQEKNPLMVHRWAWTFSTIKPFLERHGFNRIVEKPTVFHEVGRYVRDFRVEARKA
jgi:predicted SAM-dependent methyltransferase